MSKIDDEKKRAAAAAVKLIKSGMVVGLGSGSTSAIMIREVGTLVSQGLKITAVASSENSEKLADQCGISLVKLAEVDSLDINIDGADEFDPYLQLIKGGGGALLREKVLAFNSKLNVIITDSHKQVQRLGQFKLPVEVIPFATERIQSRLQSSGLRPALRKSDESLFKTDEGNYILDLNISSRTDLAGLENELLHIPGVVETGLFLNTTHQIIMGKGDEVVRIYSDNL